MSAERDLEAKAEVDLHDGVRAVRSNESSQEDAAMSKWETIKQNPTAIAWCVFAVWVVVLTSFESLASSIVLGIPEFRKDFGHPFEDNYVLDAIWQSAISGGPVAT
jgi:MFS transporter, SP family, general alpha glucoside:H+ symporter